MLRFVQLSDIHFGQERRGSVVFNDDIRERLIDDVHEQRGSRPVNGVIVTGDIAFAGKREEYRRAGYWLDRVAAAAGCTRASVLTIPGNHDIDRSSIGKFTQLGHNAVRNASEEQVDGILTEQISDPNVEAVLLEKLAAYREFAAQYESDFESAAKPFWQRSFNVNGPYHLNLIGLNSVLISGHDDELGKMVLGRTQYIIQPIHNAAHVVLVHHPLHWFKDVAACRNYLQSRAKLLIVGHEHQADWQKIANGDGEEHVVISSGATTPPEGEFHRGYTYNWLEFDHLSTDNTEKLRIVVTPRVWSHKSTRFIADNSRTRPTPTVSFEVACKTWLPHAGDASVLTDRPSEPCVEQAVAEPQARSNKPTPDDRLARLQFFFWRYLEWQDRHAVLGSLNLLPKSLTRPVQQTTERLALEAARSQHVLHQLWELIMERVPEPDRQDNPFSNGE
jgi:predicted phosphodiesterase